jgi:uncharacterized protein (UPF0210 family)
MMLNSKFFNEVNGVQVFIPVEDRLSTLELAFHYSGLAQWLDDSHKKVSIRYQKRVEAGVSKQILDSDVMEIERLEKELYEALNKKYAYFAEVGKPFVGKIVTYVKMWNHEYDAEVVHVWTPQCVNLLVKDEDNSQPTSVMKAEFFGNQGIAGNYWKEKF